MLYTGHFPKHIPLFKDISTSPSWALVAYFPAPQLVINIVKEKMAKMYVIFMLITKSK
jgi:hypothetical protein